MSNTVTNLAISARADPDIMLQLWESVKRLVAFWAKRYHRNGATRLYDTDDLLQSAFLALSDAVQKFDPERGDFTTLFHYYCRRHFAEVAGIRSSKPRPEVSALSLDMPLGEDGDASLSDTLADPAADFEQDLIEHTAAQEDCAAILAEIDKLPDAQRKSLLMTAWEGLTFRAVAEKLGVTVSAVNQNREKGAMRVRNSATGKRIAQERYSDCRRVSVKRFKETHTSEQEQFILWLESLGELF